MRKVRLYASLFAVAAAFAATPSSAKAADAPLLGKTLVTIYADHRATGWTSFSTAKVKLNCDAPVHSGTSAISVDLVKAGDALEFGADPFDSSRYGALTFWINGGATGGQNDLVVRGTEDGKPASAFPLPPLPANQWLQVIVSLTDLGLDQDPKMTGFRIESKSGAAVPTFYVDDIQLTANTRLSEKIPVPFKVTGHPLDLTGVNLSGGEFAHVKPDETMLYGKNFVYPNEKELDYFAARGVNFIRLPFRWAVMQPALDKPFVTTELDRLKSVVTLATSKGLTVMIDPHDFGRYYGKLIGSPEVPDSAFAAFWAELASEYKDNPKVYFALMNEPNGVSAAQWFASAQAAVTAIRATGAKNPIVVPGIDYTGAHGWVGNGSTIMATIKDPANNFLFEVHQYLDDDNSGTHPDAISATIGSERLKSFTAWCRTTGHKAILGEFGVGPGKLNHAAIDDMLGFMEANRDVYAGFTWWSAGPWWGDYMYTAEPTKDGEDRPQFAYLQPHMHGL